MRKKSKKRTPRFEFMIVDRVLTNLYSDSESIILLSDLTHEERMAIRTEPTFFHVEDGTISLTDEGRLAAETLFRY
jgi:hypothetical protein